MKTPSRHISDFLHVNSTIFAPDVPHSTPHLRAVRRQRSLERLRDNDAFMRDILAYTWRFRKVKRTAPIMGDVAARRGSMGLYVVMCTTKLNTTGKEVLAGYREETIAHSKQGIPV